MPRRVAIPVYMITCALHGLAFGALYAPFQALAFGLNFKGAVAWVIAGFPFDILHMLGNIAMSFLILPLYNVISKLENGKYLK